MNIEALIGKLPGIGDLYKQHHIDDREQELASFYFQKWWLTGEINYLTMRFELDTVAQEEGVDVYRVIDRLSALCNPTGSV